MTYPILAIDTPPDYLPKNWWEWLANQGLGVTVLCIGLFLVGKLLLASQAKLSALQEERIKELTTKNDKLEERLDTVESELRDCREDRKDLHERLDRIMDKERSSS